MHPSRYPPVGSYAVLMALCLLLSACATRTGSESAQREVPWVLGENWVQHNLPTKAATRFTGVRKDERHAIHAVANSSASMLRKKIRVESADLSNVKFSWKVPELIEVADMAVREKEDTPVRIVLAFEGDRSLLSAKFQAQSDLAQALMGEPLPYATLMYVWSKKRAPGSVIINSRTDRIRKLVVESGPQRLGQWLDYERDIQADYLHAFGEAPGALVGIALMTDSDNTKTQTQAWYGPVQLGKVLSSK